VALAALVAIMSPRIPPGLIVRIAAALFIACLILPSAPDVDVWGHTMFGGDIVKAGALPTRDHFSFTSDRPWINHEWLSEVLMYASYAGAGGIGLMALRLTLMALLFGLMWRTLRREGVTREIALVIVMVFAMLTYPRTLLVRPQLFSLVAFAALVAVLAQYDDRPRLRTLAPIPLIMLLWANSHGGFIVALLPLGLWTVTIATSVTLPLRHRAIAIATIAAAVAATLVNPYGVQLWEFLASTVGLNRSDIGEWGSMASVGTALPTFWAVTTALAVIGMKWHPGRLAWHRMALVALLAVASFRVSRLDAFYAIATVLCFGTGLAAFWTRPRRTMSSFRLSPAAAMIVLVLAMCGSAVLLVRATPAQDGCVDRAWWLPEQSASAFVATNHLRGRMVVFFDWGEYVLWQFGSSLKVSTDGRRETVYSDRHINGHLEIYRGSDEGVAYLRELNADYMWMPRNFPIIARARKEGWTPIYEGTRSVILASPSASLKRASWVMPEAACFPGRVGRPSLLASGLWTQG
jgi:hypothetical protein